HLAATPASITVPTGVLQYVPITITNSQSSPTPVPFQQLVTVNSASYASYEAPKLQNMEFFYANGTVVPSWLESGGDNYAANNTYWLNIASGIQAGSSVTVYLGFASPTANLLNDKPAGEAPALSQTYGQYDDG